MGVIQYLRGASNDLAMAIRVSIDCIGHPIPESPRGGKRRRMLLLQGFSAPTRTPLYRPLICRLDKVGFNVFHSPLSWFQYNLGQFEVTLKVLLEFIQRNNIELVVGHSFGGDVAYHLHLRSGIPGVAIASPLLYTPHAGVQTLFFGKSLDQRWDLEGLAKCLSCKNRSQGVPSLMSISSSVDRIVPKGSTLAPNSVLLERAGNGHVAVVLNRRIPRDILAFAQKAKWKSPCKSCA